MSCSVSRDRLLLEHVEPRPWLFINRSAFMFCIHLESFSFASEVKRDNPTFLVGTHQTDLFDQFMVE